MNFGKLIRVYENPNPNPTDIMYRTRTNTLNLLLKTLLCEDESSDSQESDIESMVFLQQ